MVALAKTSVESWATSDGLSPVVMLRSSGQSGGFKYFSFVPAIMADPIRIEWADTVEGARDLALLPANIASAVKALGFARDVTDAEVEAWNAAAGATASLGTPIGTETDPASTESGGPSDPASQQAQTVVAQPEAAAGATASGSSSKKKGTSK